MTDEEKVVMEKFGITSETKIIYRYKQHKYDNLKDAINFARLEKSNTNESTSRESGYSSERGGDA